MEQYLANLAALQLVVCHFKAGAPSEPPDNQHGGRFTTDPSCVINPVTVKSTAAGDS